MTSTSVRTQLDQFTVGFDETVGPELAAVFSGERDDLVAAGAPSGAVTAGDALPAASVVTVDGDTVDLADVLGAGPAVLVFYRGAWCPYCNITLKHYNETLAPELASRGVALVAISPQTPDGSRAAVANGDLGFTVVSDPGNTLASALGIVTAPSGDAQEAHTALGFAVKDSNADDTPAVPYPTVLIVDADRIVRTADVHVDYTTRTETEEILAAVDAL
ncbi:peroxiredoxin-like family protein [Rathayibacter sp. AY1F9]|uniref:peroxiredoxin-like family protein n=1 Tax=Rathayibacter sp. AY1F9 TaxID=2080563 RepID=UPI000CE7C64A|nr:peroxiredoxin-like family protein [Rathayibacter sp. AY1F9]PPH26661.1 peroxiredoxin [Rathayibacter sp. AY1F9]